MNNYITEYKGWSIAIQEESKYCSNYSFQITSPTGQTQYVELGGKTALRAQERAIDMITIEIAMKQEVPY